MAGGGTDPFVIRFPYVRAAFPAPNSNLGTLGYSALGLTY